jgi:CHAD domain-containing protein
MSYRIEKGERLAIAFGRIASEEIDLAMSELDRKSRGDGIHNSRKALKRLRALLSSLKVAFPTKFREENQHIAKAGRKISPLRDIHVQLRALDSLGSRGSAGERTRRALLERQSQFRRKTPALRRTVKKMLRDSIQSIATWPLEKATPHDLAESLKRIYKQGRVAFRAARKSGSPECLHEWRKKGKLLGYGFELIEKVGPPKSSKMIKRVEAMTDALGDDHDLFMVATALERDQAACKASDYRALTKRIRERRRKLQKKAFKTGRGIYAEKPGRFKKDLDRWLGELEKTA